MQYCHKKVFEMFDIGDIIIELKCNLAVKLFISNYILTSLILLFSQSLLFVIEEKFMSHY